MRHAPEARPGRRAGHEIRGDSRVRERPAATLAELDKLIADLHAAGLLAVGRDREGHATWTLTPDGMRLAELVTAWGQDSPAERVGSLLGTVAGPE